MMIARCARLLLGMLILLLIACGKDPRLDEGLKVFTANCKVCHAQGINGAPIVGNKKMWGPRAAQGHSVLVSHAISGYGLMPARGGNPSLSDEDISNVVLYMLSQLDN
ncbi:cytochrome c5 family protein [Spongiibacter sp. KMU-158]|uniref:Cytochrome c5 family protein n=1 Tax=Spongiibacter pelagi TaxID=2760804 RepID=A0A927C174_9GAMM|nr:c-type cytochrome [Spongiibacter pelagi]MBD2858142.1 cytochrome c5 family protein [Spongiibacter pelagi]